MRILVTYEQDSVDMSNIEIDVDTGSIFIDGDLTPYLSLALKNLAAHLTKFYIDMENEKENEG